MGYIIAILVGNLVTFIAGTALTWSSPMMLDLEDPKLSAFGYALSSEETSWISAMLPLGAIFGPFVFGFLASNVGRKLTLIIAAIPFFIGSLIFAFAKYPWTFYIVRFVIGMAVGGIFTVMPMYIGEMALDSNRGAFGSSMNCFICFGFFFSYAVGAYLSMLTFNLILAIFPVIFVISFAIFAMESPLYYILKHDNEKARRMLQKIRKGIPEADIEQELQQMEDKAKEKSAGTFLDIFRSKGNIKAFVMAVGLLAFQQFSGINAVLFYAEDIFKQAGSSLEPEVCSIIVGFTQFVTSFWTPFIVDRVGRKILLIISAVGIIVSEVPLGIYCHLQLQGDDLHSMAYMPIICLIGYIISFNTGLAILPWSILGEIFSGEIKSIAASSATAITWFIGFFIAKYFQPLGDEVGIGVLFWVFSGFCVLLIPFTWLYVIETKGKSLQEIQDILNR